MKVDMIIPTYRPDDTFCLLLQRLREQTFLIQRLIILNTEQSLWEEADRRYAISERLKELPFSYTLLHVTKEDFDHGGTRNLGARESDAEILIFMTQDAVPADPFLVERLIEPLQLSGDEGKTAAVAYARQLPAKDCGIIERYTREFNYPAKSCLKGREDIPTFGIKTFFCSDVCAAYRRELFFSLGGFEEPVIFNEDMFFAAHAVGEGFYVAYAEGAQVIHSHNYSVMQQFHRNFDLAVSQTAHPEIFEQISSEAEGMKLVKSTVRYLCRIGKPYLIGKLLVQCAGKYAGYFFGKRWRRLGKKQILWCTMNRNYWKKLWR